MKWIRNILDWFKQRRIQRENAQILVWDNERQEQLKNR